MNQILAVNGDFGVLTGGEIEDCNHEGSKYDLVSSEKMMILKMISKVIMRMLMSRAMMPRMLLSRASNDTEDAAVESKQCCRGCCRRKQ